MNFNFNNYILLISKIKMEKNIVYLDVGGKIFKTYRATLTCYSDFFRAMFEHAWKNNGENEEDAIFIDRDPNSFRELLNWLRNPNKPLPPNIYYELDYFGIEVSKDKQPFEPLNVTQYQNKLLEKEETDDEKILEKEKEKQLKTLQLIDNQINKKLTSHLYKQYRPTYLDTERLPSEILSLLSLNNIVNGNIKIPCMSDIEIVKCYGRVDDFTGNVSLYADILSNIYISINFTKQYDYFDPYLRYNLINRLTLYSNGNVYQRWYGADLFMYDQINKPLNKYKYDINNDNSSDTIFIQFPLTEIPLYVAGHPTYRLEFFSNTYIHYNKIDISDVELNLEYKFVEPEYDRILTGLYRQQKKHNKHKNEFENKCSNNSDNNENDGNENNTDNCNNDNNSVDSGSDNDSESDNKTMKLLKYANLNTNDRDRLIIKWDMYVAGAHIKCTGNSVKYYYATWKNWPLYNPSRKLYFMVMLSNGKYGYNTISRPIPIAAITIKLNGRKILHLTDHIMIEHMSQRNMYPEDNVYCWDFSPGFFNIVMNKINDDSVAADSDDVVTDDDNAATDNDNAATDNDNTANKGIGFELRFYPDTFDIHEKYDLYVLNEGYHIRTDDIL